MDKVEMLFVFDEAIGVDGDLWELAKYWGTDMPDMTIRELYQKAVLWAAVSSDEVTVTTDEHGQVKVSATPVQIDCRWNDAYSEASSKDSDTIQVTNSVVTKMYLTPGSVLRLGKLKDLPSGFTGDGMLRTVISSNASPDIRNRSQRYESQLARYRGTLPPTA